MNRQVPSLEEALNQLCQATWGAESAEGGGNLIEDIAKLLQTQVPRNIMSGEVLARLRNLILLPSEVAAARSLQQGDLTCISCGRRIAQASVCSYPGSGVIYCTNCYHPSYVGCTEADCTGQAVIPDRIAGFFHEPHKCSIHREANAHTPSTSIGLDSIDEAFAYRWGTPRRPRTPSTTSGHSEWRALWERWSCLLILLPAGEIGDRRTRPHEDG
jgi:hypothetical protein